VKSREIVTAIGAFFGGSLVTSLIYIIVEVKGR
jgi:hypothetical protein